MTVSKYLLIDGNNVAMRALHAATASGSALTAEDGVPTGALMIFINMVTKIVGFEQPSHVAVAWDGRSARRIALSASYKANRREAPSFDRDATFEAMRDFLSRAGIQSAHRPDQEADDLIAGWWNAIVDSRHPDGEPDVVIVSGDKDLLQLAGDTPYGLEAVVRRFPDLSTGPDYWDAERVQVVLGCQPRQWPLVTALRGDSSDNVEGIRGVGPKKALALLKRHDWNLDRALAEEFPAHRDRILTNVALVDLLAEPPLLAAPEPTRLRRHDPERPGDPVEVFLRRYDLTTLLARHQANRLWTKTGLPGRSLRARRAEGSASQP